MTAIPLREASDETLRQRAKDFMLERYEYASQPARYKAAVIWGKAVHRELNRRMEETWGNCWNFAQRDYGDEIEI